jgi:hypothetical protein
MRPLELSRACDIGQAGRPLTRSVGHVEHAGEEGTMQVIFDNEYSKLGVRVTSQ